MSERGIQDFSVLGFENSYHGNSLALAAFAHPRMAPDMGWPVVKFPESASDEAQVLEQVRNSLMDKRSSGKPVSAILIEPTQQ